MGRRDRRGRPQRCIAWRSAGDAEVDNAGAVRFDDRGRRTNIEVSLKYHPPRDKAGELVAELFKDPAKQVQRAVENFRPVVERGGLGPQSLLERSERKIGSYQGEYK